MNYINLQLVRSNSFENIINDQCGQIGSFALISTKYPLATEKRLNEGWIYKPEDARWGSKSPPLAYCTDWKICHVWQVCTLDRSITGLADFQKRFIRPCLIHDIERRLMKDDNAAFPELRAKGMSKNGLNLVSCLPYNNSLTNNMSHKSLVEVQELLTDFVIAQTQELVELLELH